MKIRFSANRFPLFGIAILSRTPSLATPSILWILRSSLCIIHKYFLFALDSKGVEGAERRKRELCRCETVRGLGGLKWRQ